MISIISRLGNQPCLVVVSAIGSTTRSLAEAGTLASQGADQSAGALIQEVLDQHLLLAESVVSGEHSRRILRHTLMEHCQQAQRLVSSIALTRQCTARSLDRVMAIGEDLARSIACAALQDSGINVNEVDSRSLIVTDASFGQASPLPEATAHRVGHVLGAPRSGVTVTQGFVASSEHGETTTMGRESSNLTASLLASCLGADDVTIWTDVDGVRTADPSMVATTYPLRHLHYDEARIAAAYGLKLLYPTMIEPARRAGIALRFAHAADPDSPGTSIDAKSGQSRPLITCETADQCSTVTALFTPLRVALRAAQVVIDELEPSLGHDVIDVQTHAHDRAMSIVVHPHAAPDVVRILHRELCENPA
jgi:aspartate kinase